MAEPDLETAATENPGVCHSCGFMTVDLHDFGGVPGIPFEHLWLCLLCASTMAGNAAVQPQQYGDIRELLQTICFVGNTVLAKLEELKETNDGEPGDR